LRDQCTAVLDACVLYPIAVADALISAAVERVFQAKWTTTIEREWIDALERQRSDLSGRLGYRRDCMREAIPDWMVPEELWTRIELNQTLPDANDMHVLAAAIACNADYIVTVNLKDFPAAQLEPYGIVAIDPDQFLVTQLEIHQAGVVSAFRGMRSRRDSPRHDVNEFLTVISANGLPMVADGLAKFVDEL